MPHKMPNPIAEYIKTFLPTSYKIWWIRGEVQYIDPKEYSKKGNTYTLIYVRDIDTNEAYELMMSGARDHHPHEKGDIVSLFGHERAGAQSISKPRFIANHNALKAYKVYPNFLGNGSIWPNAEDYTNWLSFVTKTSIIEKILKFALIATPIFLFYYFFDVLDRSDTAWLSKTFGFPMMIIAALIFGIPWINSKRIDLTARYDEIAQRMQFHLADARMPGFTPRERGATGAATGNPRGRLVE